VNESAGVKHGSTRALFEEKEKEREREREREREMGVWVWVPLAAG
jgi:hypothetical protein